MRMVLDTGVVLSALLFEDGRLRWLRRAWRTARITPLVCRDTSRELIRVLAYPKFRLDEHEIEVALSLYLPYCEIVTVEGASIPDLPRCRDENDQMFLRLAAAGKADLLISGDRALLELDNLTAFRIQSPADAEHAVSA